MAAIAGIEELKTLKAQLIKLSEQLRDIEAFVDTDLKRLNEDWDDAKFAELFERLAGQRSNILAMSTFYEEWAKKDLQRRIDTLEEANRISFG